MKFLVNYIQSAKKSFTNNVITDPELKAMSHKYVDVQTEFAMMLIDNTEGMFKYCFDRMAKDSKPVDKDV